LASGAPSRVTCGGNHLSTGKPVYVRRAELEDELSRDDYTIREWVEAPGVHYVTVDGALELLPGIRLVPTPGHPRGSQVVVVETDGGPTVIAGDTAVFFDELDHPRTERQRPLPRQPRPSAFLSQVAEGG
jgi:N-acyl homoserine lactone hydrolase